jgi:hypothetical protein
MHTRRSSIPVQTTQSSDQPSTPTGKIPAHNTFLYSLSQTLFPQTLPTEMPPPKYNPSSYTPKKPKSVDPSIKAFLKSKKSFEVTRAKERNFQRACCTNDDDLSGIFSKMSVKENNLTKKKK